jgi:hypothetical protein
MMQNDREWIKVLEWNVFVAKDRENQTKEDIQTMLVHPEGLKGCV